MIKDFNYLTAPKSKSVVVVAAGQSALCFDKINDFVEKNESKIFLTNYNVGLRADFTYFGDYSKFKSYAKLTQTRGLLLSCSVLHTLFKKCKKKIWLEFLRSRNIYKIGNKKYPPSWRCKSFGLRKDGGLANIKVCPSGVATLLCSLSCRPSSVLIAGLDGPLENSFVENGEYFFRKHIMRQNDRKYSYGRFLRMKKRIRNALVLIKKININILCPSESPVWGLKSEFKIEGI